MFIGHDYGEIVTNIESACITCINRDAIYKGHGNHDVAVTL